MINNRLIKRFSFGFRVIRIDTIAFDIFLSKHRRFDLTFLVAESQPQRSIARNVS